jgi:uracil-DNA glycosylase family 4
LNATESFINSVESRSVPVLGEGNPDASIMFIGEAPGKTEAEQENRSAVVWLVLAEMLRGIGSVLRTLYANLLLIARPTNTTLQPRSTFMRLSWTRYSKLFSQR